METAHLRVRRLGAITLLGAFLAFLGACSTNGVAPVLTDSTITITDRTSSGFTISWKPAKDEPLFGNYTYRVYVADRVLSSVSAAFNETPAASGDAEAFGGDSLSTSVTGLHSATAYYVLVTVSRPNDSATALYQGVVAATPGSLELDASVTSAGDRYDHIDPASDGLGRLYTMHVDVGSLPSDLYLVFTNSGLDETIAPAIGDAALETFNVASRSVASSSTASRVLRDRNDIEQIDPRSVVARPRAVGAFSHPISDTVGDHKTFLDYAGGVVEIPATNRATVDNIDGEGRTLSVWVADDCWYPGGTKANKVTPAMVTALVEQFVADTDSDTDIYNWVRTIFGHEWGPLPDNSPFANTLIPDDGLITILLYDIDDDDSTNGGTVGYFWSKDNYYRQNTSYAALASSNERVMFYLDAVMYATPDDGTWSSSDYWPEEIFSTLAHEFQHMINFYQHVVLTGGASIPAWLNEMLSMAAEDLVADKMNVPGPRGVAPDDPSAGAPYNTAGRMPDYNAIPYGSLTNWGSTGDVLDSYGIAYSFGAYLMRNFGGAELARALVQNPYSTANGILAAGMNTVNPGSALSLDDLLWRWGVSILWSNAAIPSAPEGFLFNNGSNWMMSTVDTTDYNLGSINAFNYYRGTGTHTGPLIYTAGSTNLPSLGAAANAFFSYGSGITGIVDVPVLVPGGTTVTVVAR